MSAAGQEPVSTRIHTCAPGVIRRKGCNFRNEQPIGQTDGPGFCLQPSTQDAPRVQRAATRFRLPPGRVRALRETSLRENRG